MVSEFFKRSTELQAIMKKYDIHQAIKIAGYVAMLEEAMEKEQDSTFALLSRFLAEEFPDIAELIIKAIEDL